MIGEIVYTGENYVEVIILEENGVKLIDCKLKDMTVLYRTEWEENGYFQHKADHELEVAVKTFEQHIGE